MVSVTAAVAAAAAATAACNAAPVTVMEILRVEAKGDLTLDLSAVRMALWHR